MWLLKLGFILDFVFVALSLILSILVLVAIATSAQVQESTPDGTGRFLAVIGCIAGLAALAFEIVAFVWLLRFAPSLPLGHDA